MSKQAVQEIAGEKGSYPRRLDNKRSKKEKFVFEEYWKREKANRNENENRKFPYRAALVSSSFSKDSLSCAWPCDIDGF
ncbi:hypothetical protein NPIL_507041 [Nephila pilipes]|uniref:Uncharacterized protein n=1 Tax=Nephila pilipes TaxID=299642 RepID=A0A8X6NBC8_NEPPI|nr:hypothetical protein NPIL_507041 [Nephila pilipes]